jgi:hypothetical protein
VLHRNPAQPPCVKSLACKRRLDPRRCRYLLHGMRGNLGGDGRMLWIEMRISGEPDADQDERRDTHERQPGNNEHGVGRAPGAQIGDESAGGMPRRLDWQQTERIRFALGEFEDIRLVGHRSIAHTASAPATMITNVSVGIRFGPGR